MTLRARTLAMVTTLLVVAVLVTSAVLTWAHRQTLLADAEAQGRLLANLLALSARFADETTAEVEEAMGEQMIVEATIAAHLVALAEAARVPPERINEHLRAIARDTVLNELWVTDEQGHAYLRNLAEIDFTFSPDPKKQPQAHIFWPLLTGQARRVVQEARPREVDAKVFKYAAVAGVDRPRIVQVGYQAEFLEQLRRKVGVSRLVSELVAGRNVIAMRVVDKATATLVFSAVPGGGIPEELNASDKALLRSAIDEQRAHSYLEGNVLKIVAPILGDRSGRQLAATIVYLPAQHVQEAMQRSLTLAAYVAAVVLVVGLLASLILARWVTRPVIRVARASQALEGGTYDPGMLDEVTRRRDEIGHLARVFQRMASEVYAREQRLKREVQQLRIEIDETKKTSEVKEITETEYFHDLRARARSLRARFQGS
jgi:HAMP domain-containing protein